ncbi:MAG TPA: hypothetical protein PLQ36_01515, partial [Candidatus Gracilibacteria bacterium]|nr:hypothetical protein [Candidatus Gracilibacteria bacterium]
LLNSVDASISEEAKNFKIAAETALINERLVELRVFELEALKIELFARPTINLFLQFLSEEEDLVRSLLSGLYQAHSDFFNKLLRVSDEDQLRHILILMRECLPKLESNTLSELFILFRKTKSEKIRISCLGTLLTFSEPVEYLDFIQTEAEAQIIAWFLSTSNHVEHSKIQLIELWCRFQNDSVRQVILASLFKLSQKSPIFAAEYRSFLTHAIGQQNLSNRLKPLMASFLSRLGDDYFHLANHFLSAQA